MLELPLGPVDAATTASARKTWLPRSRAPYSPMSGSGTVSFPFIFAFYLILSMLYFMGFNGFFYGVVIWNASFGEAPRLLDSPEPLFSLQQVSFTGTLAAAP